MSPEQALGKRVLMDHRTDVYSFGATLYELLTLRPPSAEGPPGVAAADRFRGTAAAAAGEPAIPAELETIVLKAMAKEPDGRYATATGAGRRPAAASGGQADPGAATELNSARRRWGRRHRPVVSPALSCS